MGRKKGAAQALEERVVTPFGIAVLAPTGEGKEYVVYWKRKRIGVVSRIGHHKWTHLYGAEEEASLPRKLRKDAVTVLVRKHLDTMGRRPACGTAS